MFGTNPLLRPDLHADGTLAVQESFYTLQGEGPLAGLPAVFLRLAGCNLACTFCDTEFSSGLENRMEVGDLVHHVTAMAGTAPACRLLVLTGGEPLRQNVLPFIAALLEADASWVVQIETAGTLWVTGLEPLVQSGRVVLVCSPKTAFVHHKVQRLCSHWKYIVRASAGVDEDGLPVGGTQANSSPSHRLFRPWSVNLTFRDPSDTVWLSPCDEQDAQLNAANTQLVTKSCLRYGHRLTLQLHKLVRLP